MTPREWYEGRLASWSAALRTADRRATTLSRLRLAAFFSGVLLLWWGISRTQWPVAILGMVALAAFAALVARHARVLEARDRAEAGRRLAAFGLARLDRDWRSLPEVPMPPSIDPDTHPYARDLDVFGHASLAHWLGPCATSQGSDVIAGWLAGAPTGDVRARQAAVAELAGDPAWRESLAIEGRLCQEDRAALGRFVAWGARDAPAIPRIVRRAAPVLAASIWILLIAQLLGTIAAHWWLLPLLLGVVLSFVYARPIYATFDQASAGDCVLRRYAKMLSLASTAQRSSPLLSELRQRLIGGDGAPAAVARLARLIDWSELRRAAALLHFPIQAFTLWDFHVLSAIERWRSRCGRDVPSWLEALGEMDALSVLAATAHDEPSWSIPVLDPAAVSFRAQGLAHPLIAASKRVANDVQVGPPGTLLLVTGSNMSGKSTLLRAIGLNAVLAQAGAPVCASALTLPPVELQASIRVQDSLERGLSYFMAALAALKRVVDAAETRPAGAPVMLYLLDEVLQGTNSAERAIAVRAVARHLLNAGAIGAMTTHDLAIAEAEPLASAATLVHFREQVHEEGTMTFDYRLRPGLAASRNAIRLMQLIGIQP